MIFFLALQLFYLIYRIYFTKRCTHTTYELFKLNKQKNVFISLIFLVIISKSNTETKHKSD